MPRYIDADKISYMDEITCAPFAYKEEIDSIPTADVREVKHGKWIYNNKGGTDCSVCGKSLRNNAEPNMAFDLSGLPYCPRCGARMDGGER